jgi:UDP-N-acetylglucosamine--N-acetylmuramyl-(pentapeptide) pyrophosphoryl-undecaprenol N-acetylglucosamine transferase
MDWRTQPARCTPALMRICLAASGGGHVRQLLDLMPVWSEYHSFLVTEQTALGDSLAGEHRTYFVTHVALGQAKLGRPGLMIRSAWRNLLESWRVIRAERPDVIITTGAGAVFGIVAWGKIHGAKVIAIESFARFERPSAFMRIASRIADFSILQSARLKPWFPWAMVFDPLRMTDQTRPEKEPLLFATVGATLPFDRLVEAVAELKRSGEIPERVIAQVGVGGACPPELECVETMTFDEIRATVARADLVVCHGGTGSMITALRERCRTVVMPRMFDLAEHYDNHQLEISESFEQRGLVRVARSPDELREALRITREIDPPGATTDPQALMEWLRTTLSGLAARLSSRAAAPSAAGIQRDAVTLPAPD